MSLCLSLPLSLSLILPSTHSLTLGMGAVPFFFSDKTPKDVYLGISNGDFT